MCMGDSGSTLYDPICCCVLDAGGQRCDGAGAGLRPGRAISIHAPAADQGIAIIVVAELSANPGRRIAGAGAGRIALGPLPRYAVTKVVGTWIKPLRLYSPRPKDPCADCAGRDVRRSCFQLRARRCIRRIGPQSVGRLYGTMYELTASQRLCFHVARQNKRSNESELGPQSVCGMKIRSTPAGYGRNDQA